MIQPLAWHRIYGSIFRYWLYLTHNIERAVDMFYWPIMDLLLWGLASQYFMHSQGVNQLVFSVVTCLLLWMIINRTQYEIGINLLAEMWEGNLANIFVSPITFIEWIIATHIISVIKTTISFVFASVCAIWLYQANIFEIGWYLIPILAILSLNGWLYGNLVSVLLFLFGTKMQAMVWALVALTSPFSSIYYPVSSLPVWGQQVAKFIPASYVFENARRLISDGYVVWSELWFALALSLGYLIISYILLVRSFRHSLQRGLLRGF